MNKLAQGAVYTNINLMQDHAYALYIGGSKFTETTPFLKKLLSARYKKPVDIINILPNYPPPYMDEQVAVINQKLEDLIDQGGNSRLFMKVDSRVLDQDVSDSPYMQEVIDQILKYQDDLFINVYKNSPDLMLPQRDSRIKVIGPDFDQVEYFDDKINQRHIAKELGIPIPKGYVAEDFTELVNLYLNHFNGDAFVTCSHGAGGSGTEKVSNLDDITNSVKIGNNDRFIITEFLDLTHSPSSLAIVANEEEVIVANIGDQIMDGVNYMGNIFPSSAGEENIKQMQEFTKRLGRYMGSQGYRGFFGVDFMIDTKGKLYFTEINPRKIGSTPEIMLGYELSNPNRLSLAELEFLAVTQGTFGEHNLDPKPADFSFAVKVIKAKKGQRTGNYVPRVLTEREAFYNLGTTILDHPGIITYHDKEKVARIVSVKKDTSGADIFKELDLESKKIILV